ncbi:MAG: nuclear transport factor 2 family protein [Leptolyngbyaceae cyanobacterium HOT.MB2.61]|jgi:hypothetical protein|nr:nuclear transport factor 2 family protein [Leptolyngbyaceae cyanobacterium HOT.MB2.61]
MASIWTTAIATTLSTGIFTLGTAYAVIPAQHSVFALNQKATTLSEGQIRAILDQMQAASNKRDTKTIMKFLAPDATVRMTIDAQGKSQTMTLTRSQYYQYLQQGFYITENYRGQYSNLKIQVMPNKKAAIATYVLDEEITIKNQPGTLVSSSDASMKFEIVKGQILVTSLKTVSRLEFKTE